MTKTEKAARHFKKHLSPSENLLWAGIPKITPYSILLGLSLFLSFCGFCYLIYLRIGLERSFSNFLYALYQSIPAIICLAIAVFLTRKEDQAYGFTEQRLLIKKGDGKLIEINFRDIVSVESKTTFLGWSFEIKALLADKTIVQRLYTLIDGELVDKKLRSYLKK